MRGGCAEVCSEAEGGGKRRRYGEVVRDADAAARICQQRRRILRTRVVLKWIEEGGRGCRGKDDGSRGSHRGVGDAGSTSRKQAQAARAAGGGTWALAALEQRIAVCTHRTKGIPRVRCRAHGETCAILIVASAGAGQSASTTRVVCGAETGQWRKESGGGSQREPLPVGCGVALSLGTDTTRGAGVVLYIGCRDTARGEGRGGGGRRRTKARQQRIWSLKSDGAAYPAPCAQGQRRYAAHARAAQSKDAAPLYIKSKRTAVPLPAPSLFQPPDAQRGELCAHLPPLGGPGGGHLTEGEVGKEGRRNTTRPAVQTHHLDTSSARFTPPPLRSRCRRADAPAGQSEALGSTRR